MNRTSYRMGPEQALTLADAVLRKPEFSHQDNALVSRLMEFADVSSRVGAGGRGESRVAEKSEARQALNYFLAAGKGELRDLGIDSPTASQATSDLVKQEFRDQLVAVLKATDALFDREVCTVWESATGAPAPLPMIDDTAEAAQDTAENQPDPTGVDPVISAVNLGVPTTYRTGLIRISRELVEDSTFDPTQFLAAAFAVRISRGAGPDLVSSLLADAKQGLIAAGSSANTGGAETGGTSIGTSDLINLRKSVNSAYRSGSRCGWLMNDNTLSTIDGLLDKNGRLIFDPDYDENGRRRLLGFPAFICPSMPDIALSAKSVAFGNFSYFLTRIVQGQTSIKVFQERFAEFGQIAYRAQTRVNGKLLGVTSADSPVKFLQQAAA